MKPSPKAVVVLTPVAFTAAGTATGRVDTLGFDYLSLDVVLGTADTTAHQPTVLKLAESDDTTTTVTDIVSCTGGTATSTSVGYVIPAGDTSNATVIKFNIDLKKRKRYLKLFVTSATVQVIGAVANLSVAEQTPVRATDAGASALINA